MISAPKTLLVLCFFSHGWPNPHIDWSAQKIVGWSLYCHSVCLQSACNHCDHCFPSSLTLLQALSSSCALRLDHCLPSSATNPILLPAMAVQIHSPVPVHLLCLPSCYIPTKWLWWKQTVSKPVWNKFSFKTAFASEFILHLWILNWVTITKVFLQKFKKDIYVNFPFCELYPEDLKHLFWT